MKPENATTTITDVARLAGVSSATVSRYFNGARVEKREAIKDAIAQLSYRPSIAARNLKTGRSGLIAVIVPDVTNDFFSAIVQGAESVATNDRMVLLVNTGDSREREEKALDQLLGRVDGVILAPLTEDEEIPSRFRELGIPLVFVDRVTISGAGVSSVIADNAKGAALAANHLLDHGHSRIAMIGGPSGTTPGRFRAEGFGEALSARGAESSGDYFIESDFGEQGGYHSMEQLLRLDPPPTAVFTANNLMTLGALKLLRDRGVGVPQEISLIGFDDIATAELLSPPLTAIARDAFQQGALAMTLVTRLLDEGSTALVEHSVVDVELIERSSCGPPRSNDSLTSATRMFDSADAGSIHKEKREK
jgi:LacI family transcriptional regulator|tara:strand:+ start:2022 stop:3113 length:1092 start_codon:yes stop_codon:yes gene_type:complete